MKVSKRISNNLRTGLFVLISIFMFGTYLEAGVATDETNGDEKQFRFEDEDLINFVEANREVSELRREYNEEISNSVEQMGLSMDRFNQIARAAQIGALESGNFSSEEIDAFNVAAPIVTDMRRELRSMTQALLEERGLTSELYRDILNDYRVNVDLQEYVRELLRERAREEAFQRRKREIMEEQGLTEEEAEALIIRRRDAGEDGEN